MKILINENQYNLLIERLGVPDEIANTSEKFYNEIFKYLETPNEHLIDEDTFFIYGDFKIGQYEFNKFKVKLFLFTTEQTNELIMYREAISFHPQLVKNESKYRLFNDFLDHTNTNLQIHFASPEDKISFDEIKNMFTNKKSIFIGDISHELMHFYEKVQKKSESLYSTANYVSYLQIRTGIKPLDEMLFYLYYISKVENITRPSELFGELKDRNITKREFVSYLQNSDMYKKFIKMREFNVDNIIEEMKNNYSNEINEFFKDDDQMKELPVDEKINIIFKRLYNRIAIKGMETMTGLLTREFIEALMGIGPEKEEIITKYGARFEHRESNYMNYFRKKQKEINYNADKMIKKISKMYDLLPDDKQTNIRGLEEWYLDQEARKVEKLNINDGDKIKF